MLCFFCNRQNIELFSLTPNDLGAPTAENKRAMFDWQMENDGPKSLDNYGGIDAIVKALGSNIETVRFRLFVFIIGFE